MEHLSFPGLGSEISRGLVAGTITFFSAVGVCGFVGNIVLILSVIRQSNLRSSPTFITLVSLALSDTLVILYLPFYMYVLYRGDMGPSICRLYMYGIFTAQGCSSYHLVGFSILRYVILIKPLFAFKYITAKLTLILCVTIWLLSFTGSALTLGITGELIYSSSISNASASLCTVTSSSKTILGALLSCMGLLPLILISCFHLTKAYYIRHRKVTSESPIHQQQVSTRVIVGIVLSFTLSHIPSGVGWFLVLGVPGYDSLEAVITAYLLTALTFVDSSLNPFLYFIITRRNRRKCETNIVMRG